MSEYKVKLQTQVNINNSPNKFTYKTVISGIGSCFAQYVMEHFKNLGFNISYNPNGIVYNAISIAKSLDHIVNNKSYTQDNFIKHNNLWHSWEHHGSFSSQELDILKAKIAKTHSLFRKSLTESDIFILTPSSSVVYNLSSMDLLTANCHKYPGKYFEQKILSYSDNVKAIASSIENIHKLNNKCLIIITLSPVRHYPGNLILNARSKANLLSAIHECVDKYDNVKYFPAYEILLDELRDYRFYNDDMLHPTNLARKIIINKFISSYFTNECQEEISRREKKLKTLLHKPNSAI